MAIRAPAAPIFNNLIIRIIDGKSLSSAAASPPVAVLLLALVSRFIDPIGGDVVVADAEGEAAAGLGPGASFPGANHAGVSVMVCRSFVRWSVRFLLFVVCPGERVESPRGVGWEIKFFSSPWC